MDLTYSAEDEAFRQEVRDFIEEAFTPDIRRECERSKNGYITKQGHETWQKRLYEKGWAAPNWPTEHGGAGFTPTQKFIYTQEMEAAGAPHTIAFGMTMVAPVIMKFGTEEQKAKYLPEKPNICPIFWPLMCGGVRAIQSRVQALTWRRYK